MAFGPWLRMKLEFAFLTSKKAAHHNPAPRPRRLHPTVEPLEDRTLPSVGVPPGPAAHQPPAPPSQQGPAAPAPANTGPGQSNSPAAPTGSTANSPGSKNPPAPPPGHSANGPGNGNGQGNGNVQGNNGPGAKNAQPPPSAPAPTANGPGNGKGPGNNNGKGPGNDNGQGNNGPGAKNAQPPPPAPAPSANGPGNDNGQGNDNGPGAENAPPPETSPGTTVTGPRNGKGPGNDNGPGNDKGPGAEGAQSASADFASNGPGNDNGSGEALPAEFAPAGEAFAVGAPAPEGGAASIEQTGIPPLASAESSAGLGNAELAAEALGGVSTPAGNSALVTMYLGRSSLTDGAGNPAMTTGADDLDRLFLEVWDADQLLFPDTLKPIDESLFPEGMPKGDQGPSRDAPPAPDDFFQDFIPSHPASLPLPAAGKEAVAGAPDAAAPFASPTTVAGDPQRGILGASTRLREQIPLWTVRIPGGASAHAQPRLPAVAGPALPFDQDGQGQPSTALDSATRPEHGDGLRPYHIALGMMPFLAAFGYTPASLREHVREGHRIWKRLRGQLLRDL